eukprot:jgi/Botrbrau1/9654/Bobra.0131s0029.2
MKLAYVYLPLLLSILASSCTSNAINDGTRRLLQGGNPFGGLFGGGGGVPSVGGTSGTTGTSGTAGGSSSGGTGQTGTGGPGGPATRQPVPCPRNTRPVAVQPGDTCASIANSLGFSVADLQAANPGICGNLANVANICVPTAQPSPSPVVPIPSPTPVLTPPVIFTPTPTPTQTPVPFVAPTVPPPTPPPVPTKAPVVAAPPLVPAVPPPVPTQAPALATPPPTPVVPPPVPTLAPVVAAPPPAPAIPPPVPTQAPVVPTQAPVAAAPPPMAAVPPTRETEAGAVPPSTISSVPAAAPVETVKAAAPPPQEVPTSSSSPAPAPVPVPVPTPGAVPAMAPAPVPSQALAPAPAGPPLTPGPTVPAVVVPGTPPVGGPPIPPQETGLAPESALPPASQSDNITQSTGVIANVPTPALSTAKAAPAPPDPAGRKVDTGFQIQDVNALIPPAAIAGGDGGGGGGVSSTATSIVINNNVNINFVNVLNQPPVNSGIRSPVVYAIPPPDNRNYGSNWGGGVVNNAFYPAFGQPTPVQWLSVNVFTLPSYVPTGFFTGTQIITIVLTDMAIALPGWGPRPVFTSAPVGFTYGWDWYQWSFFGWRWGTWEWTAPEMAVDMVDQTGTRLLVTLRVTINLVNFRVRAFQPISYTLWFPGCNFCFSTFQARK